MGHCVTSYIRYAIASKLDLHIADDLAVQDGVKKI